LNYLLQAREILISCSKKCTLFSYNISSCILSFIAFRKKLYRRINVFPFFRTEFSVYSSSYSRKSILQLPIYSDNIRPFIEGQIRKPPSHTIIAHGYTSCRF
jgi:hypothetical protein